MFAEEQRSVEEAEFGVYVYGIVSGSQPPPARLGIDGLHPLYVVTWAEVRAVVSRVSLAEFGEAPLEERLQDLRWLEEKVRVHEAIVEQVMRQQAILPCQFCTIYRSAGRVRDMLARYDRQCRDALAFLHDKEEWGVKAYINEQILRDHLLRTDDDLSRMERERAGKTPGLAYLMQKTLEQRLAEQVEQALVHLSSQLGHELRSYAVQAQEVSPAAPRPSPAGIRLILNAAYLIAKEQVGPFGACTQALNDQLANEGIRLVLSGPWPPYHFSPQFALDGNCA